MKLHPGFGPNSHKVIISLCDYSGRWPSKYITEGYTVAQFDLKHGDDCTNTDRTKVDILQALHSAWNINPTGPAVKVVGILAAPVCTDFSVSGAQYWAAKDADGTTARSLLLLDSCMEIIDYFKPDWWALVNPVGRLKSLRPGLPFVGWFQPHQYAALDTVPFDSQYTKKTGLWGTLKMPEQVTHNLPPDSFMFTG